LAERLLPLSAVITPNVEEAAALSGLPVAQLSHMKAAARRLHELGAPAVVITGGHLPEALDLLSVRSAAGLEQEELRAPRLASSSTHGTGCAFATALACQLALQQPLRQAVAAAKEFVRAAMAAAYPLGRGAGPIHHLYRFDK
jgi:hydroxymethylpyrimidine kinase/phosphomethylpyrimidine kinase